MGTTVADVMSSGALAVTEDTGYQEIARTLLQHRISAAPVVHSSDRVVLGVVSEEDLLHKVEFRAQDGEGYRPPLRARVRSRLTGPGILAESSQDKAEATTASGLMTSPAITILPSATVVAAARLMQHYGVKRLPVVDAANRLEGIVSRRDLLGVFLRDDVAIAAAVEQGIAAFAGPVEGGAVTASVSGGAVTLHGTTRYRSTAEAVSRVVGRIEGVVCATSALTWEHDDLMHPSVGR
jgi:CBS-domain-containing membrane protein